MNVTFIRQWIAALRSGEYSQTTGVHKQADTFCALGLGYELCPGRVWVPFKGCSGHSFVAEGGKVVPPLLFQMSDLPPDALTHIAYQLNDNGASFLEIADHLESLLPQETFAQRLYEQVKALPLIEETA